MRKEFTAFWGSLSSNVKSVIISAGAIVIATGVLFASKALFPEYDFSQLQLIVITAISGFVTNLIKNFVKTK